jgi:cerevisin
MIAQVMYIFVICSLFCGTIASPYSTFAHNDDVGLKKYIVKFKEDVDFRATAHIQSSLAFKPDHEYSMDGFYGFAGTMLDEEVLSIESSQLVCEYNRSEGSYFSMFLACNQT